MLPMNFSQLPLETLAQLNNNDLDFSRWLQGCHMQVPFADLGVACPPATPPRRNNQCTVSPSMLMMQEVGLAGLAFAPCSALEQTLGLMTPISERNEFRRFASNSSPTPSMRGMKSECQVDNALGLFPDVDLQAPELQLPTSFLQQQPFLHADTANLFLPTSCNGGFQMTPISPCSPGMDSSGMHYLTNELSDMMTPRKPLQTPDHLYPSPSLTPPITPLCLPHAESSRAAKVVSRATTTRGTRSKRITARSKAYIDRSRRPSPPARNRKISAAPDTEESVQVLAKLQFGSEILEYDNESNSLKKRWRCTNCFKTLGRKPDLHRHYKSCVNNEKHFCRDVTITDGTQWSGCGVIFSRRDALHRHLRKRFSIGCCAKSKPKRAKGESLEAYKRRQAIYRELGVGAAPRAALPASEKNRLVRLALPDVKLDMF